MIYKYVVNNEEYQLINDNNNLTFPKQQLGDGSSLIQEHYVFKKDGKVVFEAPMCYGAEGPIMDFRIVDGKPAFTYRESCNYEGNKASAKSNIFYDGQNINATYNVDESHYLFT